MQQGRHLPFVLLVFVLSLSTSSADAKLCFPSFLGEQSRLHEFGRIQVMWLDLLMRGHEVCGREPASDNETRIFALGNSTIFGFPLPSERTAIELVNRRFQNRGIPADVFNLGFVYTYQLKEVLVLSEALPYAPVLIVYGSPSTISGMSHRSTSPI